MTDLISRADAIKAVASITMSIHLSDVICDKLLALPSADTEPKRVLQGYCKGANTIKTIRHEELTQIANTRKAVESSDAVQGEWHQISPARIYECSICNHNVLTDYIDTYNYCPNCGARMKGGDTE
jgi:rubrerythrin